MAKVRRKTERVSASSDLQQTQICIYKTLNYVKDVSDDLVTQLQ